MLTFIVYGVLILTMAVEQQVDIGDKSAKKWHASFVTKLSSAGPALSLVNALTAHPEVKTEFAVLTLLFGLGEAISLIADAKGKPLINNKEVI